MVLIGFPYDEGAKSAGNRKGADYGPDSFRRFVKDIGSVRNPEYKIDISAAIPKIADYGNIQITSTVEQTKDEQGMVIGQKLIKPTMEQLYEKLQTKIGLCLKRDLIPVVIGGSRDLFQSVTDAYLAHSSATQEDLMTSVLGEHKVTVLSLSNQLDVQPQLTQKLSH